MEQKSHRVRERGFLLDVCREVRRNNSPCGGMCDSMRSASVNSSVTALWAPPQAPGAVVGHRASANGGGLVSRSGGGRSSQTGRTPVTVYFADLYYSW